MNLRKDGWRKLYDLYEEWGLHNDTNYYKLRIKTNNVNILLEAGILEKMSPRSKWYRVVNDKIWYWHDICRLIREKVGK